MLVPTDLSRISGRVETKSPRRGNSLAKKKKSARAERDPFTVEVEGLQCQWTWNRPRDETLKQGSS